MEINIKVLKTVIVSPCHILQLEKWSYPTGEDNPPYEMWTIRDRMYSPITKKTIDIGLTKFYLEDQAYQRFDTYADGYTTKSIAPLEDRTITSFKKDDGRLKSFIKHNRSYEIYNAIPVPREYKYINPTPEDVNFMLKIGDDIFIGECHIDDDDRGWTRRYGSSIVLKPKDGNGENIDLYPDLVRFERYKIFTNEYGIDEENLFDSIKTECEDAIEKYMEDIRNASGSIYRSVPDIYVDNVSDEMVKFHFTINAVNSSRFTGYYSDDRVIIHDDKNNEINLTRICKNILMGYSNGYFENYDIDDRDLRDDIIRTCKDALDKKEKQNG